MSEFESGVQFCGRSIRDILYDANPVRSPLTPGKESVGMSGRELPQKLDTVAVGVDADGAAITKGGT